MVALWRRMSAKNGSGRVHFTFRPDPDVYGHLRYQKKVKRRSMNAILNMAARAAFEGDKLVIKAAPRWVKIEGDEPVEV